MARVIDTDNFRSKAAASQGTGGNGGGTVDDILKRLGVVESAVGEIRVDVGAIKTLLPHLATKADVAALSGEVSAIKAVLPHLATRDELRSVEGTLQAEIRSVEGSLRAEIRSVEGTLKAEVNALRADTNARDTRNIKWLIGTVITVAALAFSIAKFVN